MMQKPDTHPAIAAPRIGVLLVNLGTPDAPETGAVRRYLKQFLSDRRVVEIPQFIWQPILRGVILAFQIVITITDEAVLVCSPSPLIPSANIDGNMMDINK